MLAVYFGLGLAGSSFTYPGPLPSTSRGSSFSSVYTNEEKPYYEVAGE